MDKRLALGKSNPATCWTLTFGEYSLMGRSDGTYWLEHEGGEGMQLFPSDLEAAIAKYWQENF